jgi:hypothetical protein
MTINKNILYTLYLKLKNHFDPTPPVTQEELFCVDICLKLIHYKGSRLTYAPISNKRFIKNDEKQMFIVINHRIIHIINHVYGYNIMIEDDESYNKIINAFDNLLEARRQELEDEMRKNINHSLQDILDKIS